MTKRGLGDSELMTEMTESWVWIWIVWYTGRYTDCQVVAMKGVCFAQEVLLQSSD